MNANDFKEKCQKGQGYREKYTGSNKIKIFALPGNYSLC